MEFVYISFADVLEIHDELVINRFGGSYGWLNAGALESAVAAPQQVIFGEELYPDLASKSAILFYLIVQNHCFVDGNKRTAVVSLQTFIELNAHRLDASDDELFDLAIAVATSVLDKDQVTDWLRAHVRPIVP